MPEFDPHQNPYRSIQNQEPSAYQKPKLVYTEPPAIIKWELVYCGFMTFVYLACAAMGVFFFLAADQLGDQDMSPAEARVFGVIFGVMGVCLAALFAAGFVWRKGMGGWVFHIVLISIGLTSACCWPTNIPLLIFWIKHKDYIVESGR